MIYDKLSNILSYRGLSSDIYVGLMFLQNVDADIANGVYQLNQRVKAIVSEYETKTQNEYGFEAHKKYIDIQCTLKGLEQIAYLPIDRLSEIISYDEEKDAAFFIDDVQPLKITIGDGFFAIFFPQDGHMPQLCVGEPQNVKKAVVKVEIS